MKTKAYSVQRSEVSSQGTTRAPSMAVRCTLKAER